MADTDPHEIPGTAEYEHRFSQSTAPRPTTMPDTAHVEAVLEAARVEVLVPSPRPVEGFVEDGTRPRSVPSVADWRSHPRPHKEPASTGHKPASAGEEKV